MNIGQLFLEILADGTKLGPAVQEEAGKAGDLGAKTLSQRLAAGLKGVGFKAFGRAASAAFGVAAKGALELENIQADYIAQTGASADEAKHAAAIINKAAGDNKMSLSEVADAAVKIHNDLGAVGDEADVLTAKFAEYARVTKQQAAPAVGAFDDILDAWGLQASDSAAIMDKLIVSHQRYGGSIEQNQKDLAVLAPQLKALGATVDDGIGLLNLFAVSGLDSSKAMFALNTAVQHLKPGQSIDDLIAQISAIEDPTLRAQEAVKLFGARGGVALANVLRPGVDSLARFEVSMDDAAGATDRAAEAIDSTISGRISKAISQLGAMIRGLGADWGPLVTGLASLGSLFASTGLGKALSAYVGVAWKSVASSPVVTRAVAFAVGKAETIYLAGLLAGDKLAGVLASAWGKVPGSAKVTAAASRAGALVGSLFAAAVALVPVAITITIAYQYVKANAEKEQAALAADVERITTQGTLEGMIQARDELQRQLARFKGARTPLNDFWDSIFGGTGNIQALEQQIATLDAAITELTLKGSADASAAGEAVGGAFLDTFDRAKVPAYAAGKRVGQAATSGLNDVKPEAKTVASLLGQDTVDSYVSGVLSKQGAVSSAWESFKNLLKNALTPGKQIARDMGILTSKALAKGLTDTRPEVRLAAQAVQLQTEQELAQLIAGGGKAGRKAMDALHDALHSKNPQVRAAAQRVKDIVVGQLQATKAPARAAGEAAGSAFAKGLRRGITSSGEIFFKVGAGPGRLAEGGPAPAGRPTWVGERGPEIIVPKVDSWVLNHQQSMATVTPSARSAAPVIGSLTVNVTAGRDTSPAVARGFGQAVLDEVARGLREQRARYAGGNLR